jgi:hypothetical protein
LGGVAFCGSDLNIWGINMNHYLFCFSEWLDKQFPYKDEKLHKKHILEIVSNKYITSDDDARDWIKHDLLKLYQLAYKDLQKKIWDIK